MSDGTINLPKRATAPGAPAAGRYRIFVDQSDDEVKYVDENGVIRTFKGEQGDQGIQGNDGPPGADGPPGPSGPMTVEGVANEQGDVTLPNTTNKTVIYSDTFNVSTAGNCYLIVSLAVKPHSTGNDMEFDLDFGGNILEPVYVEEHKDTSNAQHAWRSFTFPVGNVPAGNIDLDLRFSKEDTGGTAILRAYSAILVRYS